MRDSARLYSSPRHSVIPAAQTAAMTCLATSSPLSAAEWHALEQVRLQARPVRAGTELIREGGPAGDIHVLADGWACRFKLHRDGRRQISTLLAPGDVCNLDALVFGKLAYGVRMLRKGTILSLPCDSVLRLIDDHPGIARGITRLGFIENAVLAQWALCLGRQSARERMAHLLCELAVRLGCGDSGAIAFDLPLTQEHMGDVLGLTSIHVNRTLQQLRAEGLLASVLRRITIPDIAGLRQVANFDPAYLHRNAGHGFRAPGSTHRREPATPHARAHLADAAA